MDPLIAGPFRLQWSLNRPENLTAAPISRTPRTSSRALLGSEASMRRKKVSRFSRTSMGVVRVLNSPTKAAKTCENEAQVEQLHLGQLGASPTSQGQELL